MLGGIELPGGQLMAAQVKLGHQIFQVLASHQGEITPSQVAQAVRAMGAVLSKEELDGLTERLRVDRDGLGCLEPLIADPQVTDILVNGDQGVLVDRGEGLELTEIVVGNEQEVRQLAVRLATMAGRRLDTAVPFVDARLPGGIRLHAALRPVVDPGPQLSLRIPARHRWGLAELAAAAAIPPGWLPIIQGLIRNRASFLITGGTGSGKSTMLSAFLSEVDDAQRIVLVEDCAELRINHPQVVRLEVRPANVDGFGAITMTELVRQALRMRPDRLVIGEVRGAEVRELLAALNTGHDGGCGTVHANNPQDLPARLQALGSLAGLSHQSVASQAHSALNVIFHMQRQGSRRRLQEIAVVPRQNFSVSMALRADPLRPADFGEQGPGYSELRDLANRP